MKDCFSWAHKNTGVPILQVNDFDLTRTWFFGETSLRNITSVFIINIAVDYVIPTERFEKPLIFSCTILPYNIITGKKRLSKIILIALIYKTGRNLMFPQVFIQ